jgi:type I restriction enzyme M protein
VLIVEKFGSQLKSSDWIEPVLAKIDNVGFDHTGRRRDGSQLTGLGEQIRAAITSGTSQRPVQLLAPMPAGKTFEEVADLAIGNGPSLLKNDQARLGDFLEFASTGTTPPRASYAGEGLFLVKVGNLTGAGIDWYPRERNFVKDVSRILKGGRLDRLLRRGDILLTSSAHSSKYIARKVDVITTIPEEVGGRASFVGEAMLLRPRVGVDPFRLVAYLRMDSVVESIQDRVRGQTAHLHSRDMLDLPIDTEILESDALGRLAGLIQEECFLSERANQIAFRQAAILAELSQQTDTIETVA